MRALLFDPPPPLKSSSKAAGMLNFPSMESMSGPENLLKTTPDHHEYLCRHRHPDQLRRPPPKTEFNFDIFFLVSSCGYHAHSLLVIFVRMRNS